MNTLGAIVLKSRQQDTDSDDDIAVVLDSPDKAIITTRLEKSMEDLKSLLAARWPGICPDRP
jgi:hypothetical protein